MTQKVNHANHIDDIVNKGRTTQFPMTDISSRNVSCRDASERNGLMISSAVGHTEVDFEIEEFGTKSLSDMKKTLEQKRETPVTFRCND